MVEITVSMELECAFRENPVASDVGRYAASPNADDDLDEGASNNAKLWTSYFESSAIMIGKIKEMEEKGYFLEGEAHAPGAEIVMEPNCRHAHASTSSVGRYFTALPGIVASVNTQCNRATTKNFLGSRQLRWCAFGQFVCEGLQASLSTEDCVNPGRRSNCTVWMPKLSCQERWRLKAQP
jgi:hypothetical protein